jgi:hypothetical protein
MSRASDIVAEIEGDPAREEVGELANRLVSAISRGGDVEDLRPLLQSTDAVVSDIGVWVASELGIGVAPILDAVIPKLASAMKSTRYYAIDCVTACGDLSRAEEVVAVLQRLDDGEAAVRWKATEFLVVAPTAILSRAAQYLRDTNPGSPQLAGLRWLLGDGARDGDQIISTIHSPDALLRKYGVAAAARISPRNREPLAGAVSAGDPDVEQFAADWLRRA